MMYLIVIIVVVAIFCALRKFFLGDDVSSSPQYKNVDVVLSLPVEIVANHRPTMSISERERRRRNLLQSVYALGFRHANAYKILDARDHDFSLLPYYYLSNKQKIYVDPPK